MSAQAIDEAVKRRLNPKPPHTAQCRDVVRVSDNLVCATCGRTLSWGSTPFFAR